MDVRDEMETGKGTDKSEDETHLLFEDAEFCKHDTIRFFSKSARLLGELGDKGNKIREKEKEKEKKRHTVRTFSASLAYSHRTAAWRGVREGCGWYGLTA